MDCDNKPRIEKQIEQLATFGHIDAAGKVSLLKELDSLHDAIGLAVDRLDVFAQIAAIAFDVSVPSRDEPRIIRTVLPSCGGLPVAILLPDDDTGNAKYTNKEKLGKRLLGILWSPALGFKL